VDVLELTVNGITHHFEVGRDIKPEDTLAFAEQDEPGYGIAMQCGFCTPGFVMTAHGLLNTNPDPSKEEVEDALSGNICRCGCYPAITRAVLRAAANRRKKAAV